MRTGVSRGRGTGDRTGRGTGASFALPGLFNTTGSETGQEGSPRDLKLPRGEEPGLGTGSGLRTGVCRDEKVRDLRREGVGDSRGVTGLELGSVTRLHLGLVGLVARLDLELVGLVARLDLGLGLESRPDLGPGLLARLLARPEAMSGLESPSGVLTRLEG